MNIREALIRNSLADTERIRAWTPPEIGVHQVDEDTYNSWQAIRLSYLKLLETYCPATVAQTVLKPSKNSQAFRVGSAWHCAVLEPETFDDRFAVTALKSYRSQAYEEQQADSDKTLLIHADYSLVLAMRDSIYDNPINAEVKWWLEAPGQNELSVVSEFKTNHGTVTTKSRIDRYQEHPDRGGMVIVDLKTTANSAGLEGFTESSNAWGYVAQLPFYKAALEFHGLPVEGCYFIPQEKQKPYAAAVYRLSSYSQAIGRVKYERWLNIWSNALEHGFGGHVQHEQKLELS